MARNMELDVIIQISKISFKDCHLLDLKALLEAFYNDPDLADISHSTVPKTLQMLFVSTGCDFVSFFMVLGKRPSLHSFYRHAAFINSGLGTSPGVLSDVSLSGNSGSALAFIRLVGCAYFQKHRSAFTSAYPTPEAHFHSFKEDQTAAEHHSKWMQDIHNRIWSCVQFKKDLPSSDEALRRHWCRAYWVGGMWSQADKDGPPTFGRQWLD